MKNKKELFKTMWIDRNKRLPPNEDVPILVELKTGCLKVTTGKIVHKQINQGEVLFDEGFSTVQWMRIYYK